MTVGAVQPSYQNVQHITWYTQEGIFCRDAEETEGYEWSILFENEEQYGKVMEFLNQFSTGHDLRFTTQESFWKHFLR